MAHTVPDDVAELKRGSRQQAGGISRLGCSNERRQAAQIISGA
jgi:hypothetical protein